MRRSIMKMEVFIKGAGSKVSEKDGVLSGVRVEINMSVCTNKTIEMVGVHTHLQMEMR